MRAIKRFTEDEGMGKALHVYSMEADQDSNGNPLPTFTEMDVSEDISHVYGAMARPFDELD